MDTGIHWHPLAHSGYANYATVSTVSIGLSRLCPKHFETMLLRKAPMDRPAFDQMSIGASVRVAAHGFRKASWLLAADAAGDDAWDVMLGSMCMKRKRGRKNSRRAEKR